LIPAGRLHLAAAERALSLLEVSDQLGVGAAVVTSDGEWQQATYRQIEDTFKVMCASIDPSPVPSFKGLPAPGRADHLRAVRAGVEADSKKAALSRVTDALVEASVPDDYKSASASLAVD